VDEAQQLLADLKAILLAMALNTTASRSILLDYYTPQNETMLFKPPTSTKWIFFLWASSIAVAVSIMAS
jgi:hypothetical protein